MATIRDVAKLAGVGVGTVSRVLNDQANVNARTREAVQAAMKELGYEPAAAARELSGLQGKTIGLSFARKENRLRPFYFLFFESLMRFVRADGYRFEEVSNDAQGRPSRIVDAMVLFDAHDDDPRLEYLQSNQVPFVLLGHFPEVFSVAPDDRKGGYLAGKHLARLGHTSLLHVGSRLSFQASIDRYQGMCEGFHEFSGVTHDPAMVLDGEDSALGAYRAVRRTLEAGASFTGLFAASDHMAEGAIAAIRDSGLKVPFDVSVVGYDDFPGVAETLTTIHQDIPGMAASALELLKEGFNGLPPRHITLPVNLIARETTIRRQ